MRPTGSGAKSLSTLEASKNRHRACRMARVAAGGSGRFVTSQIMPPLARSLAVDPAAVRAGKEDGGDILRCAEALQQVHPHHALNQLVRFAVEGRLVAAGPGAAAATVMLRPRISLAVITVRVSTAALVAA